MLVSQAFEPYTGPPPFRSKIRLWGRLVDATGRLGTTRFSIGDSHPSGRRRTDVHGVWTGEGWLLTWGLAGDPRELGFRVHTGFATPEGTFTPAPVSDGLENTFSPRLWAQGDSALLAVRARTGVRLVTLDAKGRAVGSPRDLGVGGELLTVSRAGVFTWGTRLTSFARVTPHEVTVETLANRQPGVGHNPREGAWGQGEVLLWLGGSEPGLWVFEP